MDESVEKSKKLAKQIIYAEGNCSNEHREAQHTICAVCGKDKPTPIRNDTMGGYVCMTCIEKELKRLQTLECEQDKGVLTKRETIVVSLIQARLVKGDVRPMTFIICEAERNAEIILDSFKDYK